MKKYRYFRLVDGVRVPYVLLLDSSLLLVDDYPAERDMDHLADAVRTVMSATTPDMRHVFALWTTDAIKDNPIPGTDDLRAEYFAERDKLLAEYMARDEPCPGCETGKIMNRFRATLLEKGYLTAPNPLGIPPETSAKTAKGG